MLRLTSLAGVGSTVADQLPRLLVPKDSDSSHALRDLGFSARGLDEGLAEVFGER